MLMHTKSCTSKQQAECLETMQTTWHACCRYIRSTDLAPINANDPQGRVSQPLHHPVCGRTPTWSRQPTIIRRKEPKSPLSRLTTNAQDKQGLHHQWLHCACVLTSRMCRSGSCRRNTSGHWSTGCWGNLQRADRHTAKVSGQQQQSNCPGAGARNANQAAHTIHKCLILSTDLLQGHVSKILITMDPTVLAHAWVRLRTSPYPSCIRDAARSPM